MAWNIKPSKARSKRRSAAQKAHTTAMTLERESDREGTANKENQEPIPASSNGAAQARTQVAARAEKLESYRRAVHNGRRREKRAQDTNTVLREELQQVRDENKSLMLQLSDQTKTHADHLLSLEVAAEKQSASSAATVELRRAAFEEALNVVSATAHMETARNWEHTCNMVRSISQDAGQAIAHANARANSALMVQEEYRHIATIASERAERLEQRAQDAERATTLTVDWAMRTVAECRRQTLVDMGKLEELLLCTYQRLDACEAREKRAREAVGETEVRMQGMESRAEEAESRAEEAETREEVALMELEENLQNATKAVQSAFDNARGWVTHRDDQIAALQGEVSQLRNRASTLLRRNRTLQKRLERRDARTSASSSQESVGGLTSAMPVLHLKEGGQVPDTIRNLIRDLVLLGVKVNHVRTTITTVASAIGVAVEGSFSDRLVERTMLETWVAAQMQYVEEVEAADSITISGDSTSHKNIDYISRHVYANNGDEHTRLSMGVHPAPNHKSATQLAGLKELNSEFFQTYNASPRGQEKVADERSLPTKICGSMSDHAEDQKRYARLVQDWKKACDRDVRGERAFLSKVPEDILLRLTEEMRRVVQKLGGEEAWSRLTDAEVERHNEAILRTVIRDLGEEAYQALSAEEKADTDLFVRGGCCMHKDLNAIKGGNTRMMAFWAKNNLQPPMLLMNKDNTDASTSKDAATRRRASQKSTGGASKIAELAGGVFRHKDDKKGEQDAWRHYAETKLDKLITFPPVTSVRYGSYVDASAELIVRRQLYINYLELARDRKQTRTFTNMERNVYLGLHDAPTLSELCVFALYGQAVSIPYMREVRGGKETNFLDLGPLHDRVKAHIRAITDNPDLLLSPDPSAVTGCLDGRDWERPALFPAIQDLLPKTSNLRGALVEFFEGALETWERFTEEFAPNGPIATLTPKNKKRARMPKSNCQNEGALGLRRSKARQSPNMSTNQHNVRTVAKINKTPAYMDKLDTANRKYLRKEARRIDGSGVEKKRRRYLADEDQAAVAAKRQRIQEKDDAQAERRRRLLQIPLILNTSDPQLQSGTSTLTVKMIEDQLDWHREFYDTGPKAGKKIPKKSALKVKKDKFEALVAAVARYENSPLTRLPQAADGLEEAMDADDLESDVDMDSEWDSDLN